MAEQPGSYKKQRVLLQPARQRRLDLNLPDLDHPGFWHIRHFLSQ